MLSLKIKHSNFQNVILTILLVSGTVKPFINTFLFDLDLTLILLLIVIGDILFSLNKNIRLTSQKLLFFSLITILYLIIWVSLSYTKSPQYGTVKAFNFTTNLIYFIYPLFIIKINWKIILYTLNIIILPLAIWFIVYRQLYWSDAYESMRYSKDGFYKIRSFYLGFGSFLGLGILIIYFKKYNKILLLFYLILLIASGARGSLVFTLFIIAIYKVFTWDKVLKTKYPLKLLKKIFFVFTFLVIILTFYLNKILASDFFKLGLQRLTSLLDFNKDNSSLDRIDRFGFTIDSIFESFSSFIFGHGYGSFGIMYSNIDGREYPHNIYLESWFELGLIGLIIVLSFTIFPFFLKRNLLLKILTFYFFLGAQKTGCLSDHWILFAFYGILIFNPTIDLKKVKD